MTREQRQKLMQNLKQGFCSQRIEKFEDRKKHCYWCHGNPPQLTVGVGHNLSAHRNRDDISAFSVSARYNSRPRHPEKSFHRSTDGE